MGRGPKKHQKRLSAPKHWLLDKLSGLYAPKASPGPHKLRDCMPLVVFIRNRYVERRGFWQHTMCFAGRGNEIG